MKVAFPLRNRRELAIDFVHCDTIGLYDVSAGHVECLPPISNEGLSPGTLFEQLKQVGIDCVVSPYFSCDLLQAFRSVNIKAYKARSEKAEDNLKCLCMNLMCLFNFYDTLLCGECPKGCTGCRG